VRPKKKILLIDANENRLGIRRFLLETSGFAVLGAVTRGEAVAAAAAKPELIVLNLPLPGDVELLDALRRAVPDANVLLVSEGAREAPAHICGHLCLHGRVDPAMFLESVRLLALSKRGPRKKPPVSARNSEIELRRLA
jgi:DNA-binding NarL/FixJ family response regulator